MPLGEHDLSLNPEELKSIYLKLSELTLDEAHNTLWPLVKRVSRQLRLPDRSVEIKNRAGEIKLRSIRGDDECRLTPGGEITVVHSRDYILHVVTEMGQMREVLEVFLPDPSAEVDDPSSPGGKKMIQYPRELGVLSIKRIVEKPVKKEPYRFASTGLVTNFEIQGGEEKRFSNWVLSEPSRSRPSGKIETKKKSDLVLDPKYVLARAERILSEASAGRQSE